MGSTGSAPTWLTIAAIGLAITCAPQPALLDESRSETVRSGVRSDPEDIDMPDEVLAKALEFARREGVEPDDFHVVVHQREGSWIVSLSRKEPTLGGGYVVVVDRTTRTVEKLLPTQ